MDLDRRSFLTLLGAAAAAPTLARAAGGGMVVTDVIGRTVELAGPVARIVLLDARDVISMALLHPDPSRLVVGWADVARLDSDLLRRRYETRPDGSLIAEVGGQTPDTLSVEHILSLTPDLVVASAYMEPELGEGRLVRQLAAAGIPVVFSNAASNAAPPAGAAGDPIGDMGRAMRMWGEVLGVPARARTFTDFVADRLARVTGRLAGVAPTRAYLEVQSTYDDCCWAAGQRIWGDLLRLAGGSTLSAIEASWYVKLPIEQLMTEAPAVYIASGGSYGAGIRPGIAPGLDPAAARAGLARLVARTGFETLPAVRDGRVHGVWTGLLSVTPLNILFVEIAATWLHPALFADLDPAATLDEIGRRFLAEPLPGPCWVSLAG
ncbi:ABC transporter substrate-binding protein [Tistrella mobilis]|uniref:Solute-binding periplasmic protein of iron/siderophore ABC transporter n=1 Tax=Tistrella mobilis (strain KA081020-065) TaxID=1110502 RepID=I3TXI7_TISMK|nr:ABC transporter substrate-binding protein [Tistrella mobilis]AFK57475.1 solute-binding periplasmic protein of iron/siderophore ABC transporter [Tistrella mobilis KA081020-065]